MKTIELKADDPEIFEAFHDALAEIKEEATRQVAEAVKKVRSGVLPITASEREKQEWMARQVAAETRSVTCECGTLYVYRMNHQRFDLDKPFSFGQFTYTTFDCPCGKLRYFYGTEVELVAMVKR